jgi:hypothetical protein
MGNNRIGTSDRIPLPGSTTRYARNQHEALADLKAKMKTLPLTHHDRPQIIRMIVDLEDQIEISERLAQERRE